ncbi:MAG: hypothetical protein A2096_00690 [Spirochaetes bacterium GWF1_41_5]|nr:MAG: hypothetical protein A2096_00690 [Spirochaetes bacterium GWF1_41_5]HBE03526.1 hypothetical protein [Spirochaetia bacterium]
MKQKILIFFTAAVFSLQASVVSFMQIESSADTLGGANRAMLKSSSAAQYNASALPFLESPEVYLFYSRPFAQGYDDNSGVSGMNYFFTSGAFRVRQYNNFGASFIYLNNSDIEGYDEGGAYLGNFSAHEGALTLSYSRPVYKNLTGGIKNTLIFQSIDNYTGVGYQMGLSTSWYVLKNLAFNLNFDNIISTRIRMADAAPGYKEKITAELGISAMPIKFLMLAGSVQYRYQYGFEYNLGTQLMIRDTVFVNFSYDNNVFSKNISLENKGTADGNFSSAYYGFRELSGGLGIKLQLIKFDYNIRFHRELGITHSGGVTLYLKKGLIE